MQETTWTSASRHNQSLLQTIQAYYQLTKPRIIPLLLITTAASMWIATAGQVEPLLLLTTLVGGTLAAGAAQTINCVYDRDIDFAMERTRHRPLPSGRVTPRNAVLFAIALATLSFTLLAVFANLLSALLAMAGIAFYVCIYTFWLKRSTPQNIVIGGAAGAIPPLVGWAAVTGQLGWPAWVLFAIIFIWTPPHFWALALMIQDDYAKVGVPMLPVVAGETATARQIFCYTLALLPVTLLLVYPLQVSGAVFLGLALGLWVPFIQKVWLVLQAPTDRQRARSLFFYSILYLMLLCAGIGIDSLPVTHSLVDSFTQSIVNLASAYLG